MRSAAGWRSGRLPETVAGAVRARDARRKVGCVTSIRDLVRAASATLAGAGCETPRLDAELLLASTLGVGRERLVIDASISLPAAKQELFDELVARRVAREPVAYILGRKEFRRITLSVDRRALIPRPETELLVEFGLGLAPGARVLDVGTGSGAVALALKDERPDLSIAGVDVDADALALARLNACRLGASDVRFVRSDLLLGVSGELDAVLANLPYVANGTPLAPEIALYEPASALLAGPDGLDVVRRLTAMLAKVPIVALELGAGQAPAVSELLRSAGYSSIERLRDLAGYERVVVGRR